MKFYRNSLCYSIFFYFVYDKIFHLQYYLSENKVNKVGFRGFDFATKVINMIRFVVCIKTLFLINNLSRNYYNERTQPYSPYFI
jgi:hypothetical protein